MIRAGLPGMVSALCSETLEGVAQRHKRRFTRFGVVGISGVVINTALLYLLVQFGHMNHLIAAGIASEVSILSNFALNDLWTFRDADPETTWVRRALQYNAVALSGMVISLGILFVLADLIGIHYLLANLFSIGTATLSNYALNSRFTWGTTVRPEPQPVLVSAPTDW